MKIVTCMGGVWKLTNKAYTNMLQTIADEEIVDLDRFGTRLAQTTTDITDMDAAEAKDKLEDQE